MLADHAACVLASGARLGTEARRAGGEAERKLFFVEDFFADEIREGHFGGGDEPNCSMAIHFNDSTSNLESRNRAS